MTTQQEPQATRPRGRPRRDGPRPPLTRAAIIDAALGIVSAHGFPALTMRSLAGALDVTVRALYRHVADRQEVVDLLAGRILEVQPDRELDIDDWQESIRTLYRETRQAYRSIGRAILFAFDETVTPVEVPTRRILLPERLLAFLTGLGLTLEDALVWRQQFLTDLFGYALLIDHRHDQASGQERRETLQPVPESWLHAHPEADAPYSREALRISPLTPDELFERTADRAILAIDALRRGSGSLQGGASPTAG